MIIHCTVDREGYPSLQCGVELIDNAIADSKIPLKVYVEESFQQICRLVNDKLEQEKTPWAV